MSASVSHFRVRAIKYSLGLLICIAFHEKRGPVKCALKATVADSLELEQFGSVQDAADCIRDNWQVIKPGGLMCCWHSLGYCMGFRLWQGPAGRGFLCPANVQDSSAFSGFSQRHDSFNVNPRSLSCHLII